MSTSASNEETLLVRTDSWGEKVTAPMLLATGEEDGRTAISGNEETHYEAP